MQELYDFAVELGRMGGKNTLKYFRQSFSVETKSDDSPVTIADQSTEEMLRTEIEKRFPDDGIIGEEYGEKEGTSGRRWILDPIDGTKSFVRGYPAYGTLIGVAEGDEPVIGVIHCAALNEEVSAYKGGGCYYNGERCSVSKVSDVKKASIVMSDVAHCNERWGQERYMRIFTETGFQRTWGDCYGHLLVATGRVDAMIDPRLKIWDIAAVVPCLIEAGGKSTTDQNETVITMDHTVASNGLIHDDLLKLLQ